MWFLLAIIYSMGSHLSVSGAPNIAECPPGSMTIHEDRSASRFTCQNIVTGPSGRYGWFISRGAERVFFRMCSISSAQCNSTHQNISVTRPTFGTSVLTVTGDQAELLGNSVVECADGYGAARCNITVSRSLSIPECSHAGWIEIQEDRGASNITCNAPSAVQTMTWTITREGSPEVTVSCGLSTDQCESTDPDFSVSRLSSTSSVLTIKRNHRKRVGNSTVTCADQSGAARCKVNVIALATSSAYSFVTIDSNLTTKGLYRFDGVYSSNGTYTCTWHQSFWEGQNENKRSINVDFRKTNHEYDNKTFYYGTCILDWTLPTDQEGTYSYSLHFFPGSSFPERLNMGSVTVVRPRVVSLQLTNCSDYVYEVQILRDCECKASGSLGQPPATVNWEGLASGEKLTTNPVSRDESGKVFNCTLTWGLRPNPVYLRTPYTLRVAYGPDEVNIKQKAVNMQNSDQHTVTLLCTATGVSPSAIFTWSEASCDNSTESAADDGSHTSMCQFKTSAGDSDKVVTCTAANAKFWVKKKSATYRIPAPPPAISRVSQSTDVAPVTQPSTKLANPDITEEESPHTGAYIGGGVVAALVVIVAVVVVVVVVRKYLGRGPRSEPSPHTDLATIAPQPEQTPSSLDQPNPYSSFGPRSEPSPYQELVLNHGDNTQTAYYNAGRNVAQDDYENTRNSSDEAEYYNTVANGNPYENPEHMMASNL